jgi:uncharacterized protein (TIGR02118 family)
MIRVTVLYANDPNKRFDMDYYRNKHMKLVGEKLGASLLRAEVDKGLGSAPPGTPAPFVAVGHLYFNSLDDFQKAFMAGAAEIMADVPNYTDIQPQIQISEVLS